MLILKIAAGIIVGFFVIFLFKTFLAVTLLEVVSEQVEETRNQITPTKSKPVPSFDRLPAASIKIREPRRIISYRKEYVPGKPLSKCLGRNKELNASVLRCRHGYEKKIPVYNW